MLRLVVFLLLFSPAYCLAATTSDSGQFSRGISEILFNIPNQIKINRSDFNKYSIKSNFSTSVKLHSQNKDGSEQSVVGDYDLKNKEEAELAISEDSDSIYFLTPE